MPALSNEVKIYIFLILLSGFILLCFDIQYTGNGIERNNKKGLDTSFGPISY